jgi:protein-L-isoaspartate(D-aspartate) O-methyltransferase
MPGTGGMLRVTRSNTDRFDARFVCPTMFVSCMGARDEETAQKLSVAFKRGDFRNVRSLRRNSQPDDTCWYAGNGTGKRLPRLKALAPGLCVKFIV